MADWEPSDVPESMETYLSALLEMNKKVNLTGIRDLEKARLLHLQDSAAFDLLELSRPPKLVVDLGSGNGFPGVYVAATHPDCRVVLIERRKKKAAAIAELSRVAGLANVEVRDCDARELLKGEPEFRGAAHVVTARAVGPLADIARMTAPWISRGGRLVCWKGPNLSDEERKEGVAEAKRCGLEHLKDIEYRLGDRSPRLVVFGR
jgi:16S rRNA (guanine527-N7)-methyltransferase